jgi:hypothetical protein
MSEPGAVATGSSDPDSRKEPSIQFQMRHDPVANALGSDT